MTLDVDMTVTVQAIACGREDCLATTEGGVRRSLGPDPCPPGQKGLVCAVSPVGSK